MLINERKEFITHAPRMAMAWATQGTLVPLQDALQKHGKKRIAAWAGEVLEIQDSCFDDLAIGEAESFAVTQAQKGLLLAMALKLLGVDIPTEGLHKRLGKHCVSSEGGFLALKQWRENSGVPEFLLCEAVANSEEFFSGCV